MPLVRVEIPAALREFSHGIETVEVGGEDVGQVLLALATRFPALRDRLLTSQDRLQSSILVYLNEKDIRYLDRERTRLSEADTLTLHAALGGG
ncbi:MAG: MoaD/ThiS family protein [Thermoplasmata archaeon]|nr:MoaD/ThiS family protein [Thermoplasmata archaeon]